MDLDRFKTNCIHGIPLRMVCSECREEAGRRPGCAACIEKDAKITRLRETVKEMELRLRAVYNNDWYAIGEEELDEWRRIAREGR